MVGKKNAIAQKTDPIYFDAKQFLHRGAVKLVKQRVKAIVSDYDGTLVPTAHVKNTSTNAIPKNLKRSWLTFLLKFLSALFLARTLNSSPRK